MPRVFRNFALCLLGSAIAVSAPAQTFTTLVFFTGPNGGGPAASPVQGLNGALYGTTANGGAHKQGTIFAISPQGAFQTLHNFTGPEGGQPDAALLVYANGVLYGSALLGGVDAPGTLFAITPAGEFTTLDHVTLGFGRAAPFPLVEGLNGTIYGVASSYGTGENATPGSIFEMTPSGTLTVLYSFGGTNQRGASGVVQAADGLLYGEGLGAASADGFIYSFNPSTSAFTILHAFGGPDGSQPVGGLVQADDGNFYGFTQAGGAYNDGSIFKMTPAGAVTLLYSFNGAYTDPSTLLQGSDGNFYGTTAGGGANGDGTIFKMTPDGDLTVLYDFAGPDGQGPWGLVQSTDGSFYGTTVSFTGAPNNFGTVFRLSSGLGPFVKTLPAIGRPGETVAILGSDLTSATEVTFNGVPAAFTMISSTALKATVPSGATTGMVQVVTPNGTLKGNALFQIP